MNEFKKSLSKMPVFFWMYFIGGTMCATCAIHFLIVANYAVAIPEALIWAFAIYRVNKVWDKYK